MRLPAVLLLALALAGCGTADDREQATHAAERFYAAVRAGDSAKACAVLGEQALKAIDPCSRSVTKLELKGGPVVGARVYITSAVVDLAGGESVFLGREPTGWKVSAAGCRHVEGKPADRPADCELEG